MPLFNKGRESVPAPRPSFSPKPPAAPPKSSFGILKESLFGSGPTPKFEQKPQAKPVPEGPFGGADRVSGRKILKEARINALQNKSVVIPGTGGQKMWGRDYLKLLQERILPHTKKIGRDTLTEIDRKNILRRMRHEDGNMPSRQRRTLEERWKLRGKY